MIFRDNGIRENIMKKWGVLLIIVILMTVGCATVQDTYTAGGQDGYRVECSGNVVGWPGCYDKAKEICGEAGYVILERSDQKSAKKNKDYEFIPESSMIRYLVIKCKM